MPKINSVDITALSEAVTLGVLRAAASQKLVIDRLNKEDGAVIFRPEIWAGGEIALGRSADLALHLQHLQAGGGLRRGK